MSFSVSTTDCSSFKVKDEAAFKKWLERFPDVTGKQEADGRWWLEVNTDDGGWPSFVSKDGDPDDGNDTEIAVELIPHLAKGEVAWLKEIGMDSKGGGGYAFCTAVAWDGRHQVIQFSDVIDDVVKKMKAKK